MNRKANTQALRQTIIIHSKLFQIGTVLVQKFTFNEAGYLKGTNDAGSPVDLNNDLTIDKTAARKLTYSFSSQNVSLNTSALAGQNSFTAANIAQAFTDAGNAK